MIFKKILMQNENNVILVKVNVYVIIISCNIYYFALILKLKLF